jgi:multidrug efflux system outer membrane protein
MKVTSMRIATTLILPLALSACALAPPAKVDAVAPAQWQTPPAHNGSLTDLNNWWRQQGDPLLAQLIDAAQAASPTMATAGSRIAQSRAQRVAAGAALLPSLDAAASVSRANQQSTLPMAVPPRRPRCRPDGRLTCSAPPRRPRCGPGPAGRCRKPAGTRRACRWPPKWPTSITVCAACEQLLDVARQDAQSRADTARLTQLTADAGFQSPATAALARASAAEGNSRLILQQRAVRHRRQERWWR